MRNQADCHKNPKRWYSLL